MAQTKSVTRTETGPTIENRSLLVEMAERAGMEPKTFASTLRATVVPKEATNEEFAAFLMVAKQYNLNPLTREIFAFPKRGGGIQPIVSIDGWVNLVNSHSAYDGVEFDDHLEDDKLVAITARMWRKDQNHPTVVTEYMSECARGTDPWKQWPRRMLRHKAMIQAARYAFGFSGIADPDEGERMRGDVTNMRNLTEQQQRTRRLESTTAALDYFGKSEDQEETVETTSVVSPDGAASDKETSHGPTESGAATYPDEPRSVEDYLAYCDSQMEKATSTEELNRWWTSNPQRRLRGELGIIGGAMDALKSAIDKRMAELTKN